MTTSFSSVAEVAVPAATAVMASALPQEQQARPRPMHAGGGGGGGGANGRHHAYSRKDKSLGLLCSNFVVLYNRDNVESIGLDEAAKCLGVERHRIYDIVNVLEGVGNQLTISDVARKAFLQSVCDSSLYTWIQNTTQPNGLAVPDATMCPIDSTSHVIELMQKGHNNRSMSATALNERSSRSHRK
uniref:Kinesin motor domain-containing protein n=1 Tax=Zea mays TaxID=4577 RepID=A0A804QA12_MAIZE